MATTSAPPSLQQGQDGADTPELREANQIRFETELEFVQCLANPFFLQSLAQRNLFSSPSFLAYLSYLSYFSEPPYSQFIQYPHALHHLKLLNHPDRKLRDALLGNPGLPQELAGKQLMHWAAWREGPGGLTGGGGGPQQGEGRGEDVQMDGSNGAGAASAGLVGHKP